LRNVLVTGGSRGIGLAVARRLAASGFCVTAIARSDSEALGQAADKAREDGAGAIRFAPFDLAEVEAIPELVRRLRAEVGPIFGLVNNAALGSDGLLANMHLTQIEALIRLNTLSPIVMTKHVTRAMMAKGEGRVINIASIIASTGYSGLSVYGATKASMVGFTKSLARELGRVGITVNAVAPGFLETELTQGMDADQRAQVARRAALRRLAEVEDVAGAVDFLLGEGGRNITGTVMTVDAGATA
jgi:3-oxoacyl-[acyl-carrier protein] reductase